MAGSLNRATLIGFVGADPEIRTTQSGMKIANIRMATDESWKDRDGNRQEKTTWHSVVVMNDRLIPVVEQYVRKGSRLMAEGAIEHRTWTDRDGNERHNTEIVIGRFRGEIMLLDSKGGGGAGKPPSSGARGSHTPIQQELDDDIPFVTSRGLF